MPKPIKTAIFSVITAVWLMAVTTATYLLAIGYFDSVLVGTGVWAAILFSPPLGIGLAIFCTHPPRPVVQEPRGTQAAAMV